jgi:glycosyltransferase involved in cell wall biosynthesis
MGTDFALDGAAPTAPSRPEIGPLIDLLGENARVSVVIPALNEAENLPGVLNRLPAWLHEVILVDGGSTDGTIDVACGILREIRIVRQSGRGKGQALKDGFRSCTGNIVVVMDADGSMDPGEIGRFVAPLIGGCHYVRGSRTLPGGASSDLTLVRRFGNWFFRTVANVLHGTRYSDLCYGYFSFVRGTVDLLGLESDGFEVETEIALKAHRAGLMVVEVPSRELPRASGASHLRAIPDGWRILRTLFSHKFAHRNRVAPAIEPVLLEAPVWAAPDGNGAGYLAASVNGNGHSSALGNDALPLGVFMKTEAAEQNANYNPAEP